MGAVIGLVVLNLFAALWAWAGLRSAGAASTLTLLPVGISLAILAASWRRAAIVPAQGLDAGAILCGRALAISRSRALASPI